MEHPAPAVTGEPQVVVVDDAAAAGRIVAATISDTVRRAPTCRLGLATGSTPLPAYRLLVAELRGTGAFARVQAFLLDEYVGLAATDPASYRATIRRELTDELGVPPASVHAPDPGSGRHADLDAACADYERLLGDGVDLQLLGIGRNGHLGFNEPGTPFDTTTHVVTLSDTTRADNARFFPTPEAVPTHAVTQGLGTIRRARHLLLAATGAAKADAVAAALEGPLDVSCPASALRLHPRVTVVLDRAAAGALS
ncbi:MAG: glucosamine-6-phosphate deaminase [Acidobacteria bacterium]|nr:glucosamine-6-phosphate deaminase [Acidobacteriota bacterium]